MTDIFSGTRDVLARNAYGERLRIEPWGNDSLRIRAVQGDAFSPQNWALETPPPCDSPVSVTLGETQAVIQNGGIRAVVGADGLISFYNREQQLILQEYQRNRRELSRYCSPLNIPSREWTPHFDGDYQLTARFESAPHEKLFGMGQYQHGYLNQKNCRLTLEQRNTQASIPFVLSDQGYGFFWNNPAVGWVSFGKNLTEWFAASTKQLDYWITAKPTPAAIEEQFTQVTGRPPMMPDFAMGFWQSKLRYQTQEELLQVAREYKRRKLPISVIVVDFFHWTNHGDWKFDPDYWPDPAGMIRTLKAMGIELMVSIWPTVAKDSENYREMARKDYLVRNDIGQSTHMEFMGNTVFFDPSHPGARDFIWEKAKEHYFDKGVRLFWLDEAEPEYGHYDFRLYRYHMGSGLQTSNYYPNLYAKAFFDGMTREGNRQVINLIRCGWAGVQKYGALLWSGDVDSSFRGLREQFAAGLNTGLAGVPWWTTDIGGFLGGNPEDPAFRECMIRWFQYGAFCPVFRLHGERLPHREPIGSSGGGKFFSGADNEVWSYGDEALEIFQRYMALRERLRPYIKEQMRQAHEKGTPVIRPLFYDFPEDKRAWEVADAYLFGGDVLVAPILYAHQRERQVYLPAGAAWKNTHTGESLAGGQTVCCPAPLAVMPVFIREGAELSFCL